MYILGERRIRVHTLALPVTDKLSDLYAACNVTATVGLLGKMGKLMYSYQSMFSTFVCLYVAVDRVMSASLGDAREVSL